MIKTVSLFSQLLHEFLRLDFQYLIKRHGAEKGAKGFSPTSVIRSLRSGQVVYFQ
jgi:hypothetical protein